MYTAPRVGWLNSSTVKPPMRAVNRLTAHSIRTLTKPGLYADGGNLYLKITPSGSKSWVFRYRISKDDCPALGLGPLSLVSLADARRKALELRQQRLSGVDPRAAKQSARAASKRRTALRLTFREAAETYIKTHEGAWRGARTANDWRQTMRDYAEPVIGAFDVADVETDHIVSILSPIWTTKHKTACNVRSRIENILDWAATRGSRSGLNPARYDGHIEHLIAKHVHVTVPRPSLPYQDAHAFVLKLQARTDNDARALLLVTYTGARYNEAAAARWREFDLIKRVWTVPAERMKKNHIHEIPLSRQVVEFLKGLPGEHNADDLVFPSREGTPVANSRVNEVLRELGYVIGEASTHGFRSTLRTWVGETYKNIKREIAEAVIAHDKRGSVEQTYERTRFLKDRRPIMQAWADYLDAPPAAEEETFLEAA